MADEDWNILRKPEFIPNLERMPIHHKIGSHQRQHIGRAKTKRRQQSPKSTRRHHKYSNDQRLSRKASKANSDLWLDFNVDASLSESEDELQETTQDGTETSVLVYNNSCKKFGVTPRDSVLKHLLTDKLAINNGRLTRPDIQPLAYSLTMNNTITILDISWNNLGGEGFKHFSRMLEENVSITDLDVSYNDLGSKGAILLEQLLSSKSHLKSLNAAGNSFGNDEARCFSEALKQNTNLRQLILSDNNIQEQGGSLLAEALENNDYLQDLDLSWNQLRLCGAVAIGNSLQNNESLKQLNVSWNGFADLGCEAVGRALASNSCLDTLDLSSNRIGYEGCHNLAKALVLNNTLTCLKVNYNSITTRGALELLVAIKENHTSAIECLELQDVPVVQSCLEIATDIKNNRDNFRVIHDVTVLSEDFILRCVRPNKM
ncbi:uncharacterized protein LOC143068870 [Mytilus galloprovincialis]|uniref:uncharacterized protein LOC143068870 n=1 Tax=Mytilus galloprovincialis TaxID=29158 RepID=UPI003F7C5B41